MEVGHPIIGQGEVCSVRGLSTSASQAGLRRRQWRQQGGLFREGASRMVPGKPEEQSFTYFKRLPNGLTNLGLDSAYFHKIFRHIS